MNGIKVGWIGWRFFSFHLHNRDDYYFSPQEWIDYEINVCANVTSGDAWVDYTHTDIQYSPIHCILLASFSNSNADLLAWNSPICTVVQASGQSRMKTPKSGSASPKAHFQSRLPSMVTHCVPTMLYWRVYELIPSSNVNLFSNGWVCLVSLLDVNTGIMATYGPGGPCTYYRNILFVRLFSVCLFDWLNWTDGSTEPPVPYSVQVNFTCAEGDGKIVAMTDINPCSTLIQFEASSACGVPTSSTE